MVEGVDIAIRYISPLLSVNLIVVEGVDIAIRYISPLLSVDLIVVEGVDIATIFYIMMTIYFMVQMEDLILWRI